VGISDFAKYEPSDEMSNSKVGVPRWKDCN